MTFQTTRPLGPHEGLTVDVAIPKGVIAEPSDQQKLAWYLRDNIGTLIAVGGLVLVFLYYFQAWVRVGRDPARGVVVPRWDLPEGVSPALTHYIWNKGLTKGGFPAISAAAVNLAVKGYLELEDIGNTITLRRTSKHTGGAKFPVGEAQILNTINGYGGSLTVSKSNGTKIQTLASKFVSVDGEGTPLGVLQVQHRLDRARRDPVRPRRHRHLRLRATERQHDRPDDSDHLHRRHRDRVHHHGGEAGERRTVRQDPARLHGCSSPARR